MVITTQMRWSNFIMTKGGGQLYYESDSIIYAKLQYMFLFTKISFKKLPFSINLHLRLI